MKLSRPALFASLLAISFLAFGATDLSESPLSGATSTEIRPNILFIMDDSKSMELDYLPDWAGDTSYLYQSRNPSFNGVAYNPAVRYVPPSYITSSGSADTTTYPSQTASATSNWTAVKNDGYGVQYAASSTANLVSGDFPTFYYTTVPGEYCTDKTLKTCVAATAASATHPIAAKLRWCSTAADAAAATPTAGACQAIQIGADSGYTSFTFPRMPAPSVSVLTITGSGATSISSVKPGTGGVEILSAATASLSTPGDLANAVAVEINKCTYAKIGNCAVAGFSAEVKVNATNAEVIITSSIATTALLEVAKTGSMSLDRKYFNKPTSNQAPGENLLTAITSTIASYPKSANRSDCTGASCTYAEEMTNYANWWAYYRTRMQAMKTAASRSFEPISNKYRIGYYSINNNTNADFQNISEFDGTQKKAWYDKLFAATPYRTDNTDAQTPLRIALAKAGRLYAGKLSTLNNVSVVDPLQYYCQPNVTILSTDGYWNKEAGFTVDGVTPVGDQDGPGLEARPMLDAGAGEAWQSTLTWMKTRIPTAATWLQAKTEQLQGKVGQLQKQTYTLSQISTKTLQSKTSQWQTQEYQLQGRYYITGNATIASYNKQINQLQRSTATPRSSKYKLQTRTKTLTKQEIYKLQYRNSQVQSKTYRHQPHAMSNASDGHMDRRGKLHDQCGRHGHQ